MTDEETFLGQGWSFPPHFDSYTGTVATTSGVIDINKSLEILLSTRLGERVMVPDYGCNLRDMMFDNLDITLKTYIKDLVKTAILYHEARIDVLKIDLDTTNEQNGEILILIDYIVRTTNSRANMVFPFYKVEGSEV
jgi:phage baseplate assembly protein W